MNYRDLDSYIGIQSSVSEKDVEIDAGNRSEPYEVETASPMQLKAPPMNELDKKPKAKIQISSREYYSISDHCGFIVAFGPHKGRQFGDVATNEQVYCNDLVKEPARNGLVSKFVVYLRDVRGYNDVLGVRRTDAESKGYASFNKAS